MLFRFLLQYWKMQNNSIRFGTEAYSIFSAIKKLYHECRGEAVYRQMRPSQTRPNVKLPTHV